MPYRDPQTKQAWRQRYREREHDILQQWYERKGLPVPAFLQISYSERLQRAEERQQRAEERRQRVARSRQCQQCQRPVVSRRRYCSDACAEISRQLSERARSRRRRHDITLARRLVESLMPPPKSPPSLPARLCVVCPQPLGPHESRYCCKRCQQVNHAHLQRCRRAGCIRTRRCLICGSRLPRKKWSHCSAQCAREYRRRYQRKYPRRQKPRTRWWRFTPEQRARKRVTEAERRWRGQVALRALRELGLWADVKTSND
jgi:predicted nucleic acid-binding Zn ribbon protein